MDKIRAQSFTAYGSPIPERLQSFALVRSVSVKVVSRMQGEPNEAP